MKGCALTSEGIEDLAAKEIEEILQTKTEVKKGMILFDIAEPEDLCLLCFKAQSVSKVLFFVGSCPIDNKEKISALAETSDLKPFFEKTESFALRCIRGEYDDKETKKLQVELGGKLKDTWKKEVNLSNPDVRCVGIIKDNTFYFGIDFSREDLGKREYRIFIGAEPLKATTAYAMVRYAGFERGDLLIDPFSKSGTIPIEAAIYDANIPINKFQKKDFYFWKLKNLNQETIKKHFEQEERKPKECNVYTIDPDIKRIQSAKKNAKIAGIEKHVAFSRQETQHLEIKFDQHTVKQIVTAPPTLSKNADKKKVKDALNELFYQADYILTKNGCIVTLSKTKEILESYATKHNIIVAEERSIMQGKDELLLIKWKRK